VVGFLNGEIICYALGDGESLKKSPLVILQGNGERIKTLSSIIVDGEYFVASASSGGSIGLFRLAETSGEINFEQLAFVNVGARITCMASAAPACTNVDPLTRMLRRF